MLTCKFLLKRVYVPTCEHVAVMCFIIIRTRHSNFVVMNKTICFLILLFAVNATAQENEILVSSGEFAPYSGKSLNEKGIATQIVLAAFKHSMPEHQLNIKFLPWKRSIDYVRREQVKVSYPYFKSEQRAKEFYFSEPLYISKGLAYGNAVTQTHKSPVPEGVVCLPPGFAIGSIAELVDEYKLTLVRPNYLVQCFQLLYKQRVDYVFSNKNVAEYLINNKLIPRPQKLFPLPFFQSESGLHLITAKTNKNKQLMEKFNEGLRELKMTKQYQEITKSIYK